MTAEVFPVWEYINEELHARRWSKERLAVEMGGDENRNHCLIDIMCHCKNDKRIMLSKDTADKLAHAFGTSAELWMNLDAAFRNHPRSLT
jgi:plasmid maintenance system antidote protein VapI